MTDAPNRKKSCSGCGLQLSRYNPGVLCQACINAIRIVHQTGSGEIRIDGGKLAELRRSLGMTQHFLADRAGISASLLQKLERGKRKSASLHRLRAIASVLKVPLNVLLDVPLDIVPSQSGQPNPNGIPEPFEIPGFRDLLDYILILPSGRQRIIIDITVTNADEPSTESQPVRRLTLVGE
jgi:transcriptional regulator with XRE-family HTH domain